MPAQVAQTLLRDNSDGPLPASSIGDRYSDKILVSGNERGVITFAACCRPIPGDEIVGYLSSGKGVVVHREECRNMAELRKTPDRLIEIGGDRPVEIGRASCRERVCQYG